MGAKKNIDELIGRTLMDKDFRARLFANPDATLAAEGYEATPELLNAIKSANPDEVQAVAKGMEEQLANRKAAF
ncbi:MAG TPA: Franean1_4349 family RiPP [Polyangium sp.]|nr:MULTISPECIES: Franean1_4349 family RiPP [Polyangium]MDC0746953.1 Franean1_4349 family RiPP [Polyangium mundeleinium]MDI1434728.1 Franean1_4349 family RiPP [Polyangium sorediatum]HVK66606.1 Franean1_4349 family RiPP [Polyangium sp.]